MNNQTNPSRKLTFGARIAVLAALPLVLAGCFSAFTTVRTGPLRTEAQTIEARGATASKVKLQLGTGKLNLDGGASEVAQAEFAYNVDAWKPIVDYNVTDGTGNLTIRQPNVERSAALVNVRNEWNVKLNRTMPTDLNVQLGAGQNTLNLGNLSLSAVNVECGAGESIIDLSGTWTKSATIKIAGGVGRVTVRVPQEVGAQVKVETGLGSTKNQGLNKNGNVYTNAAFGTSPITLNISVEAGVGEVRLELAN